MQMKVCSTGAISKGQDFGASYSLLQHGINLEQQRPELMGPMEMEAHQPHTTYCSLVLRDQARLLHPTPDSIEGPFVGDRTYP